MISLEINNSTCRITGLGAQEHKQLADLMSYQVDAQAAFFSRNHRSRKRTLLDKKGVFPTGLLYIADRWLTDRCTHSVKDLRKRPAPLPDRFIVSLPHTPYLEQAEAAVACQEAGRGIVVAPTGCGKSVIAALIISAVQVRTLVVVPSLELKRQLTGALKDAFPDETVGGLGSTIAVENVDALDLNTLCNYDCVIIDEFHHSGAKTYRNLNKKAWTNVYYRFGLTATPFRSNDDERLLLESVLSEVIYRIDYKTAVAKGYIVPLEAYYIEVPKTVTDGYSWAQVYKDLVVNNTPRNEVIKGLLKKLDAANISTLCLVKEIEHGERLSSSGFKFANGQDEDCKHYITLFNRAVLTTLIGTTGVLGEGVDTKPAEYVIIAGLGKSKNAFMQQVGRGFRRYGDKQSCKILIFKDTSHKWTRAHFAAQCKILKDEYSVVPAKLVLTPVAR